MKNFFVFTKLVCIAFAVALCSAFFPNKKQYSITDFGAIGDAKTLNTQAIQHAINTCATNGGGEVIIPKGIFLTGAIFLKQGVDLHLESEAVLKGSISPTDYPSIHTRWEGTEMLFMAALINADSITNVKISGEGTVDGAGDEWLKQMRSNKDSGTNAPRKRWERPRLMCIQNCKNVEVTNLKLHNQAIWCVHVLYCENVLLNKLNITADHNIPSSDGMDIDSDKKVKITNCFIDVNDDCISIKSGKDEDGLRINRPSEDILIENCHFGYGHGGVAMGSETSGGIRNVLINNCVADASNWAPIRFKSQPSRGGVVENITYQNFKLDNTKKAVEFNMAWRMVGPAKPPAKILPVVKNVRLINVTGNVASIGDISGLEGSPIQGVSFENCILTAQKGLTIEHARNVDLSGLKITVKEGEAVTKKDVE